MIEPLNKRFKEILVRGMENDTPRYLRFILNEDVVVCNLKAAAKA